MGIDITNGISIGPGIIIKTSGSAIRNALSVAGQVAYDAATSGNFVRVSAADYNSVRTTLSNTKTIGDNADAILFYGGTYSGTCAALQTPANSNVDPGFYIIGFAARHLSVSGTVFRYLTSTSARGTYTQLANNALVANSNTTSYYIRKDPTDASLSTIYVGIVSNSGSMIQSNTLWANGAFDCADPYASWTVRFNATQPVFQTLLTGDRQW